MREKSGGPHERTAIEMGFLMDTLCSLACLENVGRRICQIVEAYSVDASRPNWGAAKHFMGQQNAVDCVPVALKNFAARKSKDESELARVRAPHGKGGDVNQQGGRGDVVGAAAGGLPPSAKKKKGDGKNKGGALTALKDG